MDLITTGYGQPLLCCVDEECTLFHHRVAYAIQLGACTTRRGGVELPDELFTNAPELLCDSDVIGRLAGLDWLLLHEVLAAHRIHL